MKISILQQNIAWAQPAENLQRANKAIDEAPLSDLYILPEMFSTGFCTNPEGIAEKDCLSLGWMQQKARQMGAAIAGSVATEDGGKFYNRFYFVSPDGNYTHYDKRHLFTYGGEHLHYQAGAERVVVEYMGVRILLAVCYDLRFPIWSRNRKDYDMAIYVACWPTPRIGAWQTLLHARAIENQCYVAGVNRVGSDPYCQYSGHSAIIDPYGKSLVECSPDQECCLTAEIDMKALEAFRQKFPVLDDADNFALTPVENE